ncbi:MAG: FAD-binding protein [Actinobacteria bacterium]|nr:FAD-binding protein [Actinomycetota bacterium]
MSTKDLDRRSFLKGSLAFGALGAAGALVGCAAKTETTAATTAATAETTATSPDAIWAIGEIAEPAKTITADVCIVGGGGTGTAAAIQAIDLGLKPVVIERLNAYGGSFIGTEGMTGFETHWAKEAGVTYTVRQAVANCLKYHHWIPQHKLYDNFFGQTAETIEWLEGHGQKFDAIVALGTSPQSWHVYDKGDMSSPGGYFMKTFGAEANKLGVEAYFNTYAKKIVMEEGKVAGLLAEQKDGSILKIEAPVVLLGCGGYANNSDLLYSVSETKNVNIQALGMNCRNGDGLIMAKDAGADFAESVGTVMWCGPVTIGAIEATWTTHAYSVGVQPTLWINEKAERFCREDLWVDDFAAAGICVRNQDKSYVVFQESDMNYWETVGPYGPVFSFGAIGTPLTEARETLTACPSVHIGDTLKEVADAVGIDATALQATIDRYNELCAAAAGLDEEDTTADEDFGKRAKYMHAVNEGPFWLLEVADGYYTTCGGIKVNENIEVIDSKGQVIPGLYAGGSDAGGLYGDSYDVAWAPGSQAAWAVNSGRLSMKNAAKYLQA